MCESRLRCQTDSMCPPSARGLWQCGVRLFLQAKKKKKKKSFFTRQKHSFSFLKRVSQPLLAARHLIQFHRAEHAGNSDATSSRLNTILSVHGARQKRRLTGRGAPTRSGSHGGSGSNCTVCHTYFTTGEGVCKDAFLIFLYIFLEGSSVVHTGRQQPYL